MKHTAGPWTATCVQDKHGPAFWLIDACPAPNQETAVAEVCVKAGDKSEANARLIAAAPELKAALEEALVCIEETCGNYMEAKYGPAPLLEKIRAALAASEGESE